MILWRYSAVFIVLISLYSSSGQAYYSAEYKAKAALIFKLTHFITWPESVLQDPEAPFVICILGRDPFRSYIDKLNSWQVKGHSVYIQRIKTYQNQHCHILFITQSKRKHYLNILKKIQKQPILSLSDISGFAEKGGMVEVGKKYTHFGFLINLNTAKKAKFKISAKLLQLATIKQ